MKNKTVNTRIVGLLIQGRKESTPGEVPVNLKVNPPASNTSEVTGTNYEKMTIKELIQNIKSQNLQVKGISKLKKAELIDILMNSD